MNILKVFTNPRSLWKTSKNTQVLPPNEIRSLWRNNMWVMTPKGIGIMFALGEPAVVHLVSPSTGETISVDQFAISDLRQAVYDEIPANRRGDREKALRLGYV